LDEFKSSGYSGEKGFYKVVFERGKEKVILKLKCAVGDTYYEDYSGVLGTFRMAINICSFVDG
jgi:hypothetical protein